MTVTEKPITSKRFIVRGRVQGVGFRWFVEREAHILGIAGWVRNNARRQRGSSGPGHSRAAHLGCMVRLREGPRAARVDDSRSNRSHSGRRAEKFSH